MNNSYYEEIMALRECEDIKRIIERWRNFAKNKTRFATDAPLVLPDMLWISKSGYGTTNLLGLLSEFMCVEGIMEFYGDAKYLEFNLEYCAGDRCFDAFDKFRDAILNAAGFRNEYRGIVCVNIDSWVEHINEKHFVDFLEYLSENSDAWHIIFVVDGRHDSRINQLEALLSVYFRIEKVAFLLPAADELYKYLEERMRKYGFEIDSDARAVLTETIEELRESKYFDGYKTLNMICSDLVYRAFSSDNFEGYVITSKIAEHYSKKSDFVVKTKNNIEKRNKIGFGPVRGKADEQC